MQTLEQKLAAQIYEQVSRQRKGSVEANEYGGMAHRLPILVRQAGLVQALAYVQARGKPGAQRLLEDLARTLGFDSGEKLLDVVRKADLLVYMHLTRKALLALNWYKRFAQSVLDVDPTEEGGRS